MLFISDASEAGSLDVLPKIPKLRQLIVGKWNPATAGAFPAGVGALRTLAIFDSPEVKNLTPIREVTENLEELSLLGLKGLQTSTASSG